MDRNWPRAACHNSCNASCHGMVAYPHDNVAHFLPDFDAESGIAIPTDVPIALSNFCSWPFCALRGNIFLAALMTALDESCRSDFGFQKIVAERPDCCRLVLPRFSGPFVIDHWLALQTQPDLYYQDTRAGVFYYRSAQCNQRYQPVLRLESDNVCD